MTDTPEERIFFEALELSARERAAFIARACADDAALRAAVDALLAANDRADEVLAESAVVRPEAPPEEKSGDRITRYKLLEKIGEGGCGVVYLAEQEEPVRRRVALKVIKLGMDTKAVVARFEAERQTLALMDHPHIAKVFDAGATGNGRPYFVMEHVSGLPITRFCDAHALTTADRLKLFMDVCQAIQHAHQKGIIHRDIKPSNVLVALHDGRPVPKVIDFGIAKATQGRLTDQTLFTAFEQFVGTPAYTSPEQATLGGGDVDTRSDIYSLGVLLYELLTGRTPFDAKGLAQAGLEEMRRQICEVDPPRPSTRLSTLDGDKLADTARQRQTVPPKLISQVRGDLDWIVMRCLEKERSRRYETASDLARDLGRFLEDEPVAARPPSTAYRFAKLVRRNRVAFAAGAAVLSALVVGLGLSVWALLQEKEARQRSVAAEARATSEAKKAEQVSRFLQSMLEGVGPSVALGRDTTLLREIADQTVAKLAELRDQPAVEAELRHTLGRVYFELGEFAKAKAMHERALELRKKLGGGVHLSVAESLRSLAKAKAAQGDFAGAEKMLRETLELQRARLGGEHLEIAATLLDLASVLFANRNPVGAETGQRSALEMTRRLRGETFGGARILSDLSLSMRDRGNLQGAEKIAREALAMQRKLNGAEHPDVAQALFALGSVLSSRGSVNEARESLAEALSIQRKVFGGKHPELAKTLYALGAAAFVARDFDGVTQLMTEALAIQRKSLGPEHAHVALSLQLLAHSRFHAMDRRTAEGFAREALAVGRKAFGNISLPVAEELTLLSQILVLLGDFSGAESATQEALSIRRALNDPGLGEGLLEASLSLRWQGKWSEAASMLWEHYSLTEKRLGLDDRITQRALYHLAYLYYEVGNYEKALEMSHKVAARLREVGDGEETDLVLCNNLIGEICRALGKFDEAIAIWKSSIARVEAARGSNHIDSIRFRDRLGFSCLEAGRLIEAKSIFTQTVAECRTRATQGATSYFSSYVGLAEVLLRDQEFPEAEKILREYLSHYEHKLSEGEWYHSRTISLLGEALVGQRKFDEGELVLLEAFAGCARQEEQIIARTWKAYRDVALRLEKLYSAWGKARLANEWREKAADIERRDPAKTGRRFRNWPR